MHSTYGGALVVREKWAGKWVHAARWRACSVQGFMNSTYGGALVVEENWGLC